MKGLPRSKLNESQRRSPLPSNSLLIVLKSYLGDAVMATPMLRSVGDFDTTVRAPSPIQELLRSPELCFSRLPSMQLRGLAHLLEEARRLRAMKFSTAILVNRSFRTALLAKLARIPTRIGHATEGRSALLTHTVTYHACRPEAASYADLLKPLGLPIEDIRPRLWVSEEERAMGRHLLAGAEIGIQPGARYPEKRLPHPAITDLLARLASMKLPAALFGGPDEEGSSLEGAVDLVGRLSLRESMGAAANLKVLVGADTGFMHVAAAVGCPTVTVFGPTSSEKWGHFEPPHQVLRAQNGDMGSVTGEELWEAVRGMFSVR